MTTLEAPEYTELNLADPLPRVLAVDDLPENLALIKGILSRMEMQLVTAGSGAEALELLEDGECAVMLLDVSMPDMDGYEVARYMQASAKHAHVPVIFLTAINRDERSVLNGYDAGVVDYLFKPVHPGILRSKVRVFLNLFNARKAQESANQRLLALQQDLIDRRKDAEEAAREIALQKAELEYRNQELMRRNRELDSFAHVVSHDLRQPVQSILDYLELISIESGSGPNGKVGRWLGACTRLGQSMHVLIADVLEFATLGTQPIVLEPTDVNAALTGALERLMSLIKESNVTITHDPLPRVSGSEKLLTRVFQNLISNAIKYKSDAPPRIQVRCHWDQSRGNWVFRVIDNGRGVDRRDFNRIFEMFARGRESSAVPGTGIGLAICKRIIEAHGGRIWLKSEPNQGSEFCFALPSAPSPQIQKME
ncbi:MAG TPA: ATP-binding protein [Bryobacteraceae bacterium]|nr:ATP-binding protein [Bryobacteraceae bacterium]